MSARWHPELGERRPRYLAIADALEDDVRSGRLRQGDRLPAQRELARALGVTVGTVSRAYSEAGLRNLLDGQVGRGTFVRGRFEGAEEGSRPRRREDVVDLSLNLPGALDPIEEQRALAEALGGLSRDPGLARLLRFEVESASDEQRARVASWLGASGLEVQARDVVVVCGAQHGLTVALAVAVPRGSVLLAEELTYPALRGIARLLDLELRPVAIDDEGAIPESVADACVGAKRPSAFYCIPTLHNPTTGVMTVARREALAETVARCDLLVIEDDVNGRLVRSAPPALSSLLPERAVFVTGVSKTLASGLRSGFVVAPPRLRERLLAEVRATVWTAPPLITEVATRWLVDGTASHLLEAKRREIAVRHGMVDAVLGSHRARLRRHPEAHHCWLVLPADWTGERFAARALEEGVRVASAEAFRVGDGGGVEAVRFCLGGVSREALGAALERLAELLAGPSQSPLAIV
jgi:DNA-binding transcriptional MocR family regulator